MGELLRQRIQNRLESLGINPFEAERRANLKRGYVNDLLIGKKDTFREKAMPALAAALECDVDYLLGRSGSPGFDVSLSDSMPLAGIVEAGAWRDAQSSQEQPEILPVTPDHRYPVERQKLFLVRGDHASALKITSGSLVLVVADKGYRDGDIVVSRITREDGLAETSIRVLTGGALSARPARGDIASYSARDGEIIGRVVRAIVLFGEPH